VSALDLTGRSVLVTGGTGSFGRRFVRRLLDATPARRVIVFSRDELKQWEMQRSHRGEERLRLFLGDVRDHSRLLRALDGVDVVVHAAALKQIIAAEYNPFEAVLTNIHGAKNLIDAAIERGVERVVALSTDKACSPINLYGATKLVSDKLFVDGNAYAGGKATRFSVVRYGNVAGSRGSVVPLFRELAPSGVLPITDVRMTRFWITLETAVEFVLRRLGDMEGGEVFVPKIPSLRVVDLARAMAPEAELRVVGVRPGEKLHEELISEHDARRTLERGDHFVLQPDMPWWPRRERAGTALAEDFSYTSENNTWWLSVEELADMVEDV
jgi:UDP-N-acetylglucosamine 4,6-dehydratase/5-epimerase